MAIRKNQLEIFSAKTLRWYGFFLSLTHLWTFLHWWQGDFFINAQSSLNAEPLCFPFFPNCDLWRELLSPGSWQGILLFYLGFSILVAISYLRSASTQLSYWGLVALTFLKLSLHLSNYNFMGNYHYMVHLISLVYLFLPHKDILIRYLIVAFYFSAGLLKINIDWLSGAAMIAPPWLKGDLLVASLFYVLVLELVFAFGLLSSNKWWRRACLFQFLIFHLFSWHIVGFFYPLVMFSLLSLFVLKEWFAFKGEQVQASQKIPAFVVGCLAVFAVAQFVPRLVSRDPSLTGSPRLFALNMFDAKTECHPLLVVHRDQEVAHLDRPLRQLGVRLACDPLVYLNQAYQLCRENERQPDFQRLSLSLMSKRVTESQYHKVLDIPDVCALRFPLWAEMGGSQ